MRNKDRIRSRMKQQRDNLKDYYLATAAAAASTTKVTTDNNFEAKRSRMRQQRDSLKDYYLATAAVSTTKVRTSSSNNNFETKKNEKMVVAAAEVAPAAAAAAAPAPPTTFAQEVSRFWCTAFGDTESASYGWCSSNSTICSGCPTKDDSSSDNRNPDDRNPTTKKKSSSDFGGRRDDSRNLYTTRTSSQKRIEDANSLLTRNESSQKITSHPASPPRRNNINSRNWEKESVNSTLALADESLIGDESTIESSNKFNSSNQRSSNRIESPPPPLNRNTRTPLPRLQSLREDSSLVEPTTSKNNDNDDVNHFLQYIESVNNDIKRKEEIKIANILSHDCVNFNSRDDCNSTIQTNGASTILTFDEANHYHRHQKSPRFINCCGASDALPGLLGVEEEEEEIGGGNNNASTDPMAAYESFDDALSTAVLKPVVDYVKITPIKTTTKRDFVENDITDDNDLTLPSSPSNHHMVDNAGRENSNGAAQCIGGGDYDDINSRHHVTASAGSTNSRLSKQSDGSINSRHSVVGSLILDKLRKYLPYDFQLKYSMTRHGSDLQTVLEKTESCIYTTLLVVETTDGETFGT
jgi:hypothetical protein